METSSQRFEHDIKKLELSLDGFHGYLDFAYKPSDCLFVWNRDKDTAYNAYLCVNAAFDVVLPFGAAEFPDLGYCFKNDVYRAEIGLRILPNILQKNNIAKHIESQGYAICAKF